MLNSVELIERFREENHFTLSKIAHELRNPLTLMNSTLQMIEFQNPQMKNIEYWNQLNEDLQDIFELISELTAYEKQQVLLKEPVNLISLLEKLICEFIPADNCTTDILLQINTPEAKKNAAGFYCDRVKLKQVFMNLIKNALEAMEEGTESTCRNPKLTIDISVSAENPIAKDVTLAENSPLFLCIAFQDNGPGIPAFMKQNLFTPFVSGKSSGTGIGLSIARDIVLAHNGYLDAASSENGSCFSVFLPIP